MNTQNINQIFSSLSQNIYIRITFIVSITIILHLLMPILAKVITSLLIKNGSHNREKEKYIKTISHIFNTSFLIVLWVMAVVLMLNQFGIKVSPFLTGAGILGAVIGFGAQNIIKDILAGIFIIAENQYRVGDIVTLHPKGKEVSGTVESITLRVTKVRDMSGKIHTVRNDSSASITNHTFRYAKINLDILVGYETDIDLLEKIINKIGQKIYNNPEFNEYILEAPHFLRVTDLADSGINIKIVGKVKPGKQFIISGEIRRQILKDFKKNNITIPYPHITIDKN